MTISRATNAMKTEHRSEAEVVEGNDGNHKLINTADARKKITTSGTLNMSI